MKQHPSDPPPDSRPSGPGLPPSWLANVTHLLRDCRLALGYKTQEAFALDHGYTPRQWRKIEKEGKVSRAQMHVVPRQLKMDPSIHAQFVFLLTGDAPSCGLRVDEARTVGEGVKRVAAEWASVHVYPQIDPTVLVDGCWNVEHFNQAWATAFERVRWHPRDHPLVNPMRFALFHPEAPQIIVNWKDGWLITLLCQFAYQYYANPDNAELQDIRDRIRCDEVLEGLYAGRVGDELAERGIDRIFESDVKEQQLLLPGLGEHTVLVTMGHPWFGRHQRYEVVTLSSPDGKHPLLGPASASESDTISQPFPHTSVPAAVEERATTADREPSPAAPAVRKVRYDGEFALTVGQLLKKARIKTGWSQEKFPSSAPLGLSVSTWVKLERDVQLPKKDDLAPLAAALAMSPSVGRLLYGMTTQAEPPTQAAHTDPETDAQSLMWARIHLERLKSPSVLMDGAWNVTFSNSAYRELFAHVPADPRNHPVINPFRYVLFHEDARQTLADWYDVWLTPWLVELGSAILGSNRGASVHAEHLALYDEIEADSYLKDVYEGRVMRDLRGAGATIGFESDGDVRGMYLPAQQADGSAERRYLPMLVTAGVPSHSKKIGGLFTTMTPLTRPPHLATACP